MMLGIEGGPRAGQALDIEADSTGFPPLMVNLEGVRYVREPFRSSRTTTAGTAAIGRNSGRRD